MDEIAGTLVITKDDSARFAQLSGDHNPLHVDSRYARRLQFGRTVVHGVHHLLRILDRILGQTAGAIPGLEQLASLRVRFQNPAWEDGEIRFNATYDPGEGRLSATGYCDARPVVELKLQFGDPSTAADGAPLDDAFVAREAPREPPFPPALESETLPLALQRQAAASLFPHLCTPRGSERLAQLLACTRVVGMRCPGLHSVFSGLNLNFAPATTADPAASTLSYRVKRADPRVRLVTLDVGGHGLSGTLDTFYRPEPVTQARYAEVQARLPAATFAGRRALVIGGSRGLGEVTAKLLAAGGARVVITYQRGADEAQAVAEEIVAGGGDCTPLALDVTALDGAALASVEASHVYFFASPHIDAVSASVCGLSGGVSAVGDLPAGAARQGPGDQLLLPLLRLPGVPGTGLRRIRLRQGRRRGAVRAVAGALPGSEVQRAAATAGRHRPDREYHPDPLRVGAGGDAARAAAPGRRQLSATTRGLGGRGNPARALR